MNANYTIETAKGSCTGTLLTICRWQAEYQGAAASIGDCDLSRVDFDPDDIGRAVQEVHDRVVSARHDAVVNRDWDAFDALGGNYARLHREARAAGDRALMALLDAR